MLRAVLDANVFVSAAVHPQGPPGRIIEHFFLRDAAFELVLSAAVADEVRRVLNYPRVVKAIRGAIQPTLWFEDIVALADFVSGEHELASVSQDPDDDKYIAAAVEGRAAFVVTGDRHLLAVAEYEGVRIITPRAFLELLPE